MDSHKESSADDNLTDEQDEYMAVINDYFYKWGKIHQTLLDNLIKSLKG